jgi:hypothetical protein
VLEVFFKAGDALKLFNLGTPRKAVPPPGGPEHALNNNKGINQVNGFKISSGFGAKCFKCIISGFS